MLRIGEFSKLSGLSNDALYHYEKRGILLPVSVDDMTGYRYYEAGQLILVNKIMALKDAGFSLDEIATILRGETIENPALLAMLEDKARDLENSLSKEYNRLERLHTNIFLIKNGGISHMNEITIKRVEPITVASCRRTFPKDGFDENLGRMWPELNAYIDTKGVKKTIPCLMLYHSGWWDLPDLKVGYDDLTLDVEVAEPVTRTFEGNDDVKVYQLPLVEKMASIIHRGPFSTISKSFEALFDWMKSNQYVADGPVREIYHKGDWVTSDPEEYVTELQIPVK